MDYRREIDGLRAVAVLPVILFHAGFQTFSGGYVGVDVFFVISGYLITAMILGELEQDKFSIINFYERRARRILPVLFFVMLISLPFSWYLLLPDEMSSFSKSLISISGFFSNVFFWSERGYFGTAIELKPLIHTWSLSVEEQYYLLFPLILIILKWNNIVLISSLSLLGLFSFGLCIWLTNVHVDSAFYLLPTRFWELLVGSFVAISGFRNSQFFANNNLIKGALEVFGLSLLLYSILFFDSTTKFPGYAALVPTIGAALIITFSTSTSLIGRILSNSLFVGLGLISYSAYLWHQPIFAFLRHSSQQFRSANELIILILLTLVLSYGSWRFVEKPFRDRMLWSRTGIFTFSFFGMLFFAFIGIAGWKSDGLISRFNASDQAFLREFVDAGAYTGEKFNSLKLNSFDAISKKRVLVIGDSFGMDLVNAIAESQLSDYVQISTHQINSECGNLYIFEDFTRNIQESKLARCIVLGWYENAQLQQLMHEADAIWLASAWSDWVAAALPRSISNIESTTNKPVLVFGRKNFGSVNIKELLLLGAEQRLSYTSKMTAEHLAIIDFMSKSLPAEKYIDISLLLCGSMTECRLFTNDGTLISYDGGHLTKGGAKYLGELLFETPTIKSFLSFNVK